jgi:putative DNA primase/helicase
MNAKCPLPVTFRTVNFGGIPLDLRSVPRWGLWRYEERDGRPTKVPYSVVTGVRADSTNITDWSDFD